MTVCAVCDKEAVLQCCNCRQLLYCGDEHKKKHLESHRTECKLYRIEKNSKYGRYLVTRCDVQQGELLIRERPVVVGTRVDSLPACLECLTLLPSPLPRCAICTVIPVCAKCTHNILECQLYAALSPEYKELLIRAGNQHVLPLKVLLNIRDAKGDERYKKIMDLESHQEIRRGSPVWLSHQHNVVELLQVCGIISESEEDAELVLNICSILDVNSFEVRGAMGLAGAGMRLRGVYVEAALMAHDCVMNVHLSVDDNFVMSIRASVDIPAGQPIFYNYTDPLQMTYDRQKHLREGKYFACTCKRCSDPTELGTNMGGVLCPRCHKGLIQYSVSQNFTCNNCSHRFWEGMMSMASVLARDYLDSTERTHPLQLEETLKRLAYSFCPTHSVMIDAKQSIVAAYRECEPTTQGLQRKIQLCKELLPILRVIEPGISRLRGITLYELHVSMVMLAQMTGRDVELLKEAEEVLREAVSLLLYEPNPSPEGELARQALSELRSLKQLISKQDQKDKKIKNKVKHKNK